MLWIVPCRTFTPRQNWRSGLTTSTGAREDRQPRRAWLEDEHVALGDQRDPPLPLPLAERPAQRTGAIGPGKPAPAMTTSKSMTGRLAQGAYLSQGVRSRSRFPPDRMIPPAGPRPPPSWPRRRRTDGPGRLDYDLHDSRKLRTAAAMSWSETTATLSTRRRITGNVMSRQRRGARGDA